MPGNNVEMVIKTHRPTVIETGSRFNIREGGRTVATGFNHQSVEVEDEQYISSERVHIFEQEHARNVQSPGICAVYSLVHSNVFLAGQTGVHLGMHSIEPLSCAKCV
jgi:Elongation factor Tu C-terminal domain